MRIQLIDINPKVTKAWEHAFKDVNEVSVHNADLFSLPTKCIVSPANSFGFMDGGVDAVISKRLPGIQERVQQRIKEKFRGELLVGESALVSTKDKDIPLLISAPTMRYPKFITNTENVYLAAKAIFYCARYCNRIEEKLNREEYIITIPGLGTATGGVDPDVAASQMRHAYNHVFIGQEFPKTWHNVKMDTYSMLFKKYEH